MRVIDFMPRRGDGPPRLMRIIEGLGVGFRCRWSSRRVRTTPRSSWVDRPTASLPPPGRTPSPQHRPAARGRRRHREPPSTSARSPRAAHPLLAPLLRGDATGRGRRLGARPHGVVAGVERALRLPGSLSRRGADLADRPKAMTSETTGAWSRRRPPRCRRTSEAYATGTTATAGCATRCSRSRRCSPPVTPRRHCASETSCFGSARVTRAASRSCTESASERPHRVRARRASRLRGLPAGADRQRGFEQFQLDVYGEVIVAYRLHRPGQGSRANSGRAGERSSSTSRRSGVSPTTVSGRRADRVATSPIPR